MVRMGSALRLRRQVSLPMSGPRTVQSEEVLKREIQLDRMSTNRRTEFRRAVGRRPSAVKKVAS